MKWMLRWVGVGLVLAAACDPRTETEVVQSALTCAGDSDCNDSNPCTDDACDLGAHTCKHFNNNVSCNDGNACTVNDVCNSGSCLGGDVSASCSTCAAAVTIPSAGGSFTGTVQGSTYLRGSCDDAGGSPERVYAWTPTSTGTATIQTCGGNTNYDTILYVLSSIGSPGTCSGSGEKACNDDTPGCGVTDGLPSAQNHGSRVNVPVTAGQTYYIVVDGWGGRKGTFTLTVTPPTVCGNNIREGAETCDGTDASGCPTGTCKTDCTCQPPTSGLPDLVGAISNVQVQRNASVVPGDVAEGCASAMTGLTLLRFSAKTSNTGTADIVLGNPQCPDCSVSSNWNMTCGNPAFKCSGAGGHNHAHYSNYAKYELLDSTGTVLRTGHKQGFCLRDSICAGGTAKYDCNNQGVTAGCGDVYDYSLGCQYIDITGVADGAYTLRMIVDPFNQIPELDDTGNNMVTMPITLGGMAPPPEVVPAIGGTFTGSTGGASFYSGACAAGPSSATPEHVFAWTPNASGSATFSSCSPNTKFDTVMYVSTNMNGSAPLACEDDTPGCGVSDGSPRASNHGTRITMNVTAGTTYYIFVDSYSGSSGATSGQYAVTIVPPAGSTTGAGGSGGAGAGGAGSGGAGAGGTGGPVDAGTDAAADSGSTGAGGMSGAGGSTPDAGAGGMSGIAVIPSTGGSITGTTSGSSRYTGTCATSGSNTAPDAIYQFTPTKSGTATFQTCSPMTLFDTVLYVKPNATSGELACADDTIGCATGDSSPYKDRHGSRFNLSVVAGTTYYVVVDGYTGSTGGSQGQFVLTVTPPP